MTHVERTGRRLEALRTLAVGEDWKGVLLSAPADIRWASGFTGSNARLLVLPDRAVLSTDGRYTTQAADEVAGAAEVRVPGYDLMAAFDELEQTPESVIAIQDQHLSARQAKAMGERFGSVRWEYGGSALDALRAVKEPDEIDTIERAQRITEAVLDHVLGLIEQGVTEREIAAEIVCEHLRLGAEDLSFDPIVAFGDHAALPHARPTDRALRSGDVVLIDMGGVVDGYASDMTRTFVFGEAPPRFWEVYTAVQEALDAATGEVAPGVEARAVDAAARDVLDEAGLADHFTHSTGHGVGLDVHEAPRVSARSEDLLRAGMVITIEPGVYLPGAFGVRLENLVVVEEDGPRVLTQTVLGREHALL